MSNYHIAMRTESIVSTTLDVKRDNLTDLRVELARFVGELSKNHANAIWANEDWRVDATDGDGLILYVMHVSAQQAPAAKKVTASGS